MITSIDSNVMVGLWNPDDALNHWSRKALDAAFVSGGLTVCGAVYGELIAGPHRGEKFVDEFLHGANIKVDWSSNETIWRIAGSAFQKYAARRPRARSGEARRILTDFYIGAHALENGYSLLTLDDGIYRAAFPKLSLFRV
jgi:hypothetical protein